MPAPQMTMLLFSMLILRRCFSSAMMVRFF
jgi:hypothetical protein